MSTGTTPLPLGNRMVVGQRLFSSGFLRSYNTRLISKVCVYSFTLGLAKFSAVDRENSLVFYKMNLAIKGNCAL